MRRTHPISLLCWFYWQLATDYCPLILVHPRLLGLAVRAHRGGESPVAAHVQQVRGTGVQGCLEGGREFRRRGDGGRLQTQGAGKPGPIMHRQFRQGRRARAFLDGPQPDVAQGAVVDDHKDDREAVTGRGLDFQAVHQHATVAGNHCQW